MSRGPGIHQRRILEALEANPYGWIYVRELLPRRCRQAEYSALQRAAWKLEEAGKVCIFRFWLGGSTRGGGDANKLVVAKPGTEQIERHQPLWDRQRERRKCGAGDTMGTAPHLGETAPA